MHILKKIAFVLFSIIFVLAISVGIFAKIALNLAPRDIFFSVFAPSREDLSKEAKALTRSYPSVIKGNWEPSPFHLGRILRKEAENLKKLGVNTISIVPNYGYKNGTPRMSEPKEALIDQIVTAKKQGFAVLLSPDFVGGDEDYFYAPLKQFLKDAESIALEWAAIAEEFQVEFFAPQNEFDLVIRRVFQLDPARHDEAIGINNRWHRELLPDLERVYGGQLMLKAGSVSALHDPSGYDYFGQDFGHEGRSLDQFREFIRYLYPLAAETAGKSQTEWLIAEAWMPYKGVGNPVKNEEGQSLDEVQDDYFRIAMEEYLAFAGSPRPSGFIFIAYLMPGMDVKGRPAEAVISAFFSKMKGD